MPYPCLFSSAFRQGFEPKPCTQTLLIPQHVQFASWAASICINLALISSWSAPSHLGSVSITALCHAQRKVKNLCSLQLSDKSMRYAYSHFILCLFKLIADNGNEIPNSVSASMAQWQPLQVRCLCAAEPTHVSVAWPAWGALCCGTTAREGDKASRSASWIEDSIVQGWLAVVRWQAERLGCAVHVRAVSCNLWKTLLQSLIPRELTILV